MNRKGNSHLALIGFFIFIGALFVVAVNSPSFNEERFSEITGYAISQDVSSLKTDSEAIIIDQTKNVVEDDVEIEKSDEVIDILDEVKCSVDGEHNSKQFSLEYKGTNLPVYYSWRILDDQGENILSKRTGVDSHLKYNFEKVGKYDILGSAKLDTGNAISFSCGTIQIIDDSSFFLAENQSRLVNGASVLLERVGKTSVVVSVNGDDRGVISVGEYKVFDDLDGQLALDSVFYVEGASDNGALFTFVKNPVVVNDSMNSINPKEDGTLISTITSFFINLFRS